MELNIEAHDSILLWRVPIRAHLLTHWNVHGGQIMEGSGPWWMLSGLCLSLCKIISSLRRMDYIVNRLNLPGKEF